TGGLVAGEGTVANEEGRAGGVEEAAASPLAALATGGAGAADGLVVAEGTVANRCHRAQVAVNPAAGTGGQGRTQRAAAEGHVAAERAVSDGQGAALVEDAAALAPIARGAESLVLGHDHPAQAQAAAGVPDAAAVVRAAVRDRQVVDGHGNAAADPEDRAGVAAADGQYTGAGSVDRQGVGDVQLAAGQGDGAVQPGGEVNHVGTGRDVSGQDGRPQRPEAAVSEVQDCKGGGDDAIVQLFDAQPGRQRPLREPCRTRSFLGAVRHEEGTCGSQPG